MSDPAPPPASPEPMPGRDPRRLRASDTDRDAVAEAIREAAGDGRLTLDEVEERLTGVYAARTYAELEKFTEDLPEAGAARPVPVRPTARRTVARIGGTPGPRSSIAVMSGTQRRGGWVVPHKHTAVAFWGGVELDLRDARFAEQETTIYAFAAMGGINIIVPKDIDVVVGGTALMGGFSDSTAPAPAGSEPGADPNRPVVRVTGFAFWGGVNVEHRDRKPAEALESGDAGSGNGERPELESG